MKKFITICLFVMAVFEMSSQSISKMETFEGLNSVIGKSSINADAIMKKNKFEIDTENDTKIIENITFITYNSILGTQMITIGIRNEIVVMALLTITSFLEEDSEFEEIIANFKISIKKSNYKLVKEDNQEEGWQTGFYFNKSLKQKIAIRTFKKHVFAEFSIYLEEIEPLIMN